LLPVFEQSRKDDFSELPMSFRLTKKRSNVDEEILRQDLRLRRILTKSPRIVLQVLQAMQSHSAFDAAQDGVGLVIGEIDPGSRPQHHENGIEISSAVWRSARFSRGPVVQIRLAAQ